MDKKPHECEATICDIAEELISITHLELSIFEAEELQEETGHLRTEAGTRRTPTQMLRKVCDWCSFPNA